MTDMLLYKPYDEVIEALMKEYKGTEVEPAEMGQFLGMNEWSVDKLSEFWDAYDKDGWIYMTDELCGYFDIGGTSLNNPSTTIQENICSIQHT